MLWSVHGAVNALPYSNLLTVTINIYFKGNIKKLLQSKILLRDTRILVGNDLLNHEFNNDF